MLSVVGQWERWRMVKRLQTPLQPFWQAVDALPCLASLSYGAQVPYQQSEGQRQGTRRSTIDPLWWVPKGCPAAAQRRRRTVL